MTWGELRIDPITGLLGRDQEEDRQRRELPPGGRGGPYQADNDKADRQGAGGQGYVDLVFLGRRPDPGKARVAEEKFKERSPPRRDVTLFTGPDQGSISVKPVGDVEAQGAEGHRHEFGGGDCKVEWLRIACRRH